MTMTKLVRCGPVKVCTKINSHSKRGGLFGKYPNCSDWVSTFSLASSSASAGPGRMRDQRLGEPIEDKDRSDAARACPLIDVIQAHAVIYWFGYCAFGARRLKIRPCRRTR